MEERTIMQYESDIWAIADYFISAGIKQSDFPRFMMPFFALVMLESRMRKVIHRIEKEEGISRNSPYFVEAFRDEDCGYNAVIVEQGTMLADICLSDGSFEQDFRNYLQGFDENIKMLLGIGRSTEQKKFLNIDGIAGELKQKKILLPVVKEWAKIDLEPYDNSDITTLEEHIKRKWADMSAETAGEQYTPYDIISLISDIAVMMVARPNNRYLHIYDPTCGGANLLFGVADRLQNAYPLIATYGSEWNDALFALAAIESRFRGFSKIHCDNTLTSYPFADKEFDLVVANPPYGTSWKGFADDVRNDQKGQFQFFPSMSDGQLLFMQHDISRLSDNGVCIEVHNGSSLFSGDAGGGESNIRKNMFDHDYVDAIIQMPSDEFFNTGIYTYLWIFNKQKPTSHRDKVMLINASNLYEPLKKSMGSKRRQITADQRRLIVDALRNYEDCELGKVYDKWHFYYNKQSLTLIEQDDNGLSVLDTICSNADKVLVQTDEYYFDAEHNTIRRASDDEAIGCGKFSYKKRKDRRTSEETTLTYIEPLTTSDYEIIPYSSDADENERNIQSFLDKYVTKQYIRRENTVGVELNFNKEFYVPEVIPAADDVLRQISELEQQINAIEI